MQNTNKTEFYDKQDEYRSLPYGTSRIAVMLEALAMSSEIGIPERLSVLNDLSFTYVLGDDPVKALPTCAEFFELLEQCPKYRFRRTQAPNMAMIAYSVAISLPQIPIEQWKDLLEQFHTQVKKYGIGERLWQTNACNFAILTGDLVKADEHLKMIYATDRDIISECEACEAGNIAECLLDLGRCSEAENVLKPVFDGAMVCEQQPWSALTMLINHFLDNGELEKAIVLEQRLKRKRISNRNDLTYIGSLLYFHAYVSPFKAITLLEKGVRWSIGMWDQQLLFGFYRGAWALCTKISEQEETISLSLPKKFVCWQESGIYNTSDLAKWFHTEAIKIANKFDKRNGSDYYSKKIVPLRSF